MKLIPLLEGRKLLAVVYGGRFQPFHKGHYSVYREMCKTFGEGAVWIATSNKTNFNPSNGDVSPFTFDERAEIMTQMFGISPDKIIKCKNPAFSPVEVLELYKAPVVCVMVAGDKDVERYSSSESYKPYPTKKGRPVPFDHVASELLTATGDPPGFYYLISDARDGVQSGTKIREAFQAAGDDHAKQVEAFRKFYGPKINDDVLDLLVSKIKMIKKPEPKKKTTSDVEKDSKLKEGYQVDSKLKVIALHIQQELQEKDIESEITTGHDRLILKTTEGSVTIFRNNGVIAIHLSPGSTKFFSKDAGSHEIAYWVRDNL